MASHVKGYNSTSEEVWGNNPICSYCGHVWPCDVAQLLEAVQAAFECRQISLIDPTVPDNK